MILVLIGVVLITTNHLWVYLSVYFNATQDLDATIFNPGEQFYS